MLFFEAQDPSGGICEAAIRGKPAVDTLDRTAQITRGLIAAFAKTWGAFGGYDHALANVATTVGHAVPKL